MLYPTRLLCLVALAAVVLGLPADAQNRAARDNAAAEQRAPAAMSIRPTALATPVSFAITDRRAGGMTVEIRADWRRSLADDVASLGLDDAASYERASLVLAAGAASYAEPLALPSLDGASVSVLAADFDEAPAPLSASARAELAGATAEVVAVGVERKQAVGTLLARLLRYDAGTGRLLRYRRLVLSVQFATPFASDAAAQRATSAPDAVGSRRLLPVNSAALRGGSANPHVAVTRSVLAEGTWFKVPIAREGLYRIDRSWIEAAGLDAGSVDPSQVRVYSNGGRRVPAANSAPRLADLAESPRKVTGGGDGAFSGNDQVLFFAEGARGWAWDTTAADWRHWLNPMTRANYAFVRVDAAPGGATVGDAAYPNWPGVAERSRLETRLFQEEDVRGGNLEISAAGGGLDWLGRSARPTAPRITVLDTIAPGRVAGTVRFRARAAIDSNPRSALSFERGGRVLVTREFSTPSDRNAATDETLTFEDVVPAGEPLQLRLVLDARSVNATAWIDYVEAFYTRELTTTGDYLRFHTPGGTEGASGGRFGFALSGFSAEPEVWDVTEPNTVRRLGVRAEAGRYLVQVEAEADAPRELLAFVSGASAISRAPSPEGGSPIANQNLHGVTNNPTYLVVTHEDLLPAAEALAARRAERDGLVPLVATSEQIYNEFSGGKPDFRAVRDFARLFYDRAGQVQQMPRFLLLFGDGHYDYRGIEEGGDDNNLVPVYETIEMLIDDENFTSDDYFGLLDENEGEWVYTNFAQYSTERLDLGIGRIPARTRQEAEAYVQKVIRYEDPATYGAWRGRATYLADDSFPGGDDDIHVLNAEVAANEMRDEFPALNLNKIYLPLYEPVQTAFGRRLPGAEADAIGAFENGTLIWNYSGHGSKDQLADERIFSSELADRLTNLDRLAIGVTATCTFGRFDMIARQSGAERLTLNPQGGAIAMFTTTRVVYTSSGTESLNPALNRAFTQSAFERAPDGRPRRLGDVMYYTKTRALPSGNVPGAQGNSRKFALLGDPAVRVGVPERPVQITRLSGAPLPQMSQGDPLPADAPELRALTRTEIEGQVYRIDGAVDAAFDGEVELLVYDAARREQMPDDQVDYVPEGVEVRSDLIWRGRATAAGGQFRAVFVVPQDVSYSGEPGRIYAYVRPTGGSSLDGQGFSEAFTVSTTAGDAVSDGAGPEIRLFVGDSTFVEGGLVGPEDELIVRLRDPSGLNSAGAGIGHELLLSVDGNEAEATDIGERFVADLDSYTSGEARVALPELEPGAHRVRVRAWDVTNNASEAEISFVVGEDERLALGSVYNYPNPMSRQTTFVIDHNRSGQNGRVLVRIYTVNGRLVRTLETDAALSPVASLEWDGSDEDGDRVASGVYLYQVRVEAERADGGREVSERLERLAIIR